MGPRFRGDDISSRLSPGRHLPPAVARGRTPYQQPERKKALDGLETWLRERLRRHRGNADVPRQELAIEKALAVSLRTVERALYQRPAGRVT